MIRKLVIGFVSGAAGIAAGCVALIEVEQWWLRRVSS
jgi:hypothetical protein